MDFEVDNLVKDINWEAKGIDRALQNAKNILMTHKGEVPYMRDLGVDTNIYEQNVQNLKIRIKDEAAPWFKGILGRFKGCELENSEEGLIIRAKIGLEVRDIE